MKFNEKQVMTQTWLCSDIEEFNEISKKISRKIRPGDVVFLNGEIGAGKTTFVKQLGKVMGIKMPITSPTFNIIKTYEGKLCHIDGYRLQHDFIEIEEYLNEKYVICIEWADLIQNEVTPNYIINIYYEKDGRKITVSK